MDNVVCILVDSVIFNCIGTTQYKITPTPFLDSLRREGISASKLYSPGPYTDAATKSLYTGRYALDDYGYYFKLNSSPSNHFNVFHENGYETYGLYYPYYMIGRDIKRDIDHSFFTSGFLFSSEWGGIYSHYKKIIEKRNLSKYEKILLIKRMALMFEVWIDFYKEVRSNPSAMSLIVEGINNFKIDNALKILEKEEKEFKSNPASYIKKFLLDKAQSLFATLDNINMDAYINREYLKKNYIKHKKFFRTTKLKNIYANVLNNTPTIGRILRATREYFYSHDKEVFRFIKNYLQCLTALDGIIRNSYKKRWQIIPSAKRQLQFAGRLLHNRRKYDPPFYMSLHLLDPHEPISFFSYDINSDSEFEKEMNILDNFSKSLGATFSGSLPYILSLRYVDHCIEEFSNELKQMNLWDSTTILIVADHGSSYSYFPLHGTQVNCFDDECYHVPMIIRKPNACPVEINNYHNTMDVFPTLFDVLGIEKPGTFIGETMLTKKGGLPSYIITEYMGPGCPDLLSKRIWFSIRDSHYLLAYKVAISENFEDGEVIQVFDLKKDPNCYMNIVRKIQKNDIYYLLNEIKPRFQKIKIDTEKFLIELEDEYYANET